MASSLQRHHRASCAFPDEIVIGGGVPAPPVPAPPHTACQIVDALTGQDEHFLREGVENMQGGILLCHRQGLFGGEFDHKSLLSCIVSSSRSSINASSFRRSSASNRVNSLFHPVEK